MKAIANITAAPRGMSSTRTTTRICAENNLDVTTGKLYPMPIAARPDF
jgi:hypothetical protein